MPAPRIVGLVFLVAAGCAGGESVPPREPVVQPAAPSAGRPTGQSAAKKIHTRYDNGDLAHPVGDRDVEIVSTVGVVEEELPERIRQAGWARKG